ncbi:hypothetical protein C4K88_11960 [Arthrobacter pityocampae]|uniref:DUF4232 domain-containing protein n=1 Tax=Arthrobacter pityocampae TaxID=547334 RepID=A0A2S5IV78_9MICC|nr:hypothetical protein [Arthrobacter pityocampae]PPB48459.1 hypothetical protein C4K88_11960 [Arthrobacter pityocampae]
MASREQGTGPTGGGGRRPSAVVYRRRRLAVAVLGLLVLVALAVGGAAMAGLFGGQDGAGDSSAAASTAPGLSASRTPPSASAAPSATPSSTATATSTAAPGASPSSSGRCDPAAVVVVAATDERTYSPDETPVLSLIIRNSGTAPCTVNVGTSQMEFVLTRGADRVFSSVDCQESSEDLDRVIEPKGEERATFEWARNRTVPGCTVVDGEPETGEYTLTARLGARSSAPVTFTLQ